MKKITAVLFVFLLAAGTAVAAETAKPSVSETKGAAVSASKAIKPDGAKLFETKACIACHGRDAAGMKGLAPSLKDSKFVKTAKDEELKAVIRDGRSGAKKLYKEFASAMPANNKLSEDELNALCIYLKGLGDKTEKNETPKTAPVKKPRKVIEGC